jgi:uncharacterized protein YifE (UPF0438 family)
MGEHNVASSLHESERALLQTHLRFYRALATGRRKPATPAQKHFIKVTLGHAAAETVHEIVYMKWMRLRVQQRARGGTEARDPHTDGPTDGWFTRDDWNKLWVQG